MRSPFKTTNSDVLSTRDIHAAGLSSSLPDQLKQILDVVTKGLSRGNAAKRAKREQRAKQAERDAIKNKEVEARRERIREGLWHDGRIDAVCGNGVMSELGVGVERFTAADAEPLPRPGGEDVTDEKAAARASEAERQAEEARRKQERLRDLQTVESMPVVVIKNFETKGGGSRKEDLLDALAQWAATLAENQVRIAGDGRCGSGS